MFQVLLPAADLVAVVVLTLALYYPRHRRTDLLLSFLAVNISVLAVATALAATSVNVGLGLGLFGVLAMIRLRSEELQQHEIAYYFSSLALGLIGGLGAAMGWTALALMAAIVVVLAVADSPRGVAKYSRVVVLLDRAVADPAAVRAALEQVLGGRVGSFNVRKLDLVNDSTLVEVSVKRPAVASGSAAGLVAAPVAAPAQPVTAQPPTLGPVVATPVAAPAQPVTAQPPTLGPVVAGPTVAQPVPGESRKA
ncbi:MAG: DUF4956 domain-containing protein [Propionibacteriaceae bacterium]|nr:DUF4956 domain-containing protein [Propionibacteriaceae bacterium]